MSMYLPLSKGTWISAKVLKLPNLRTSSVWEWCRLGNSRCILSSRSQLGDWGVGSKFIYFRGFAREIAFRGSGSLFDSRLGCRLSCEEESLVNRDSQRIDLPLYLWVSFWFYWKRWTKRNCGHRGRSFQRCTWSVFYGRSRRRRLNDSRVTEDF